MPSATAQTRCRKCGAPMEADDKLCVSCGTYASHGLNVKTVQRAKTAGRATRGMVIGGIVAFVCGVLWALLAVALKVEIGYAAWGIGLVTGLTVVAIAQESSVQIGMAAACLALMGLLIGKAGTFIYGVKPMLVQEIREDDDVMARFALMQLAAEGTLTDEDVEAMTEEMLVNKGRERVSAMTTRERDELAASIADIALEDVGLVTRLGTVFSLWDILWFALALSTAYRIGAGGNDD